MKKITVLLLLSLSVLSSCEKVVTLPLETAAPRLVIDASIACVKGVPLSTQTIKLSTTAPFYASEVPAVSGANVSISSDNGSVFEFTEIDQTGVYQCTHFEAILNANYTLLVNYNGNTYTATESLQAVPMIDKIEQEVQPKIGGGGTTIDIKTFFTDPAESNDFYLVRVHTNRTAIPEYSTTDDVFFQGNQMFDFYRNEDLVPGDVVTVRLGRISQRYHNYMKIITSFSGNNGGGPFSTPPSTVRGNIVNTTNPELFVLGYFSVAEVVSQSYTIH